MHTARCCSCPITGMLPMANWPQHGRRQAGKEERWLEGQLHRALTALWQAGAGQAVAGARWAWMEPVHTWTSKALPWYWLWGPEGLLSCDVHLGNLRSQGQHSDGGLKHLETLSLWQAHISPRLPVHHCHF